jgi:hypothetical protein
VQQVVVHGTVAVVLYVLLLAWGQLVLRVMPGEIEKLILWHVGPQQGYGPAQQAPPQPPTPAQSQSQHQNPRASADLAPQAPQAPARGVRLAVLQ